MNLPERLSRHRRHAVRLDQDGQAWTVNVLQGASAVLARTGPASGVTPRGVRDKGQRANRAAAGGLASLSERERQVLAHLAVGESTKEIAYTLGISAVTVRVLVARAAIKLGVRSRAALLDHPEIKPLRCDSKAP